MYFSTLVIQSLEKYAIDISCISFTLFGTIVRNSTTAFNLPAIALCSSKTTLAKTGLDLIGYFVKVYKVCLIMWFGCSFDLIVPCNGAYCFTKSN